MSASALISEGILFLVLLILVSIQVTVYKSCSNDVKGSEGAFKRHNMALVNIANHYISENGDEVNFTVAMVSKNCYKCSLTDISTIAFNTTYPLFLDTTFPLTIQISSNGSRSVCNLTHHFREASIYNQIIMYNASAPNYTDCSMTTMKKGVNAFLPILYAAVVVTTLSLLWAMLCFTYRFLNERGFFKYFHLDSADRLTHRDLGLPTTTPSSTAKRYRAGATKGETHPILNSSYSATVNVPEPSKASSLSPSGQTTVCLQLEDRDKTAKRLVSLDAFRGMSLMIMIFVNYGGGGYWFFDHSIWNGLTVADLVFPWFIWIMGVSLVFSFRGRRKDSTLKVAYQIIRRTIILFAVGLFLNTSEDTPLSKLRIPGVLQRFSITYLIVALTELCSSSMNKRKDFALWAPIKDITSNLLQWVMVAVLEAAWLLLTFLVHDKGCPRGYLGPGGIADYGRYQECTGGAAGAIDRWLLGNNHIYDSATAKHLYRLDLNHDPEGVLGTLNSIVLCFLGVQAGKTLLTFRGKHLSIIGRFAIWGLALSMLGTLLCLGEKNEGLIPLNKNLWSLSFILLMGGTGYLVLALFYLTIDTVKLWNGSPFRYPGMNSIIVYVGHELLGGFFPFAVYNQEKTHLTYLTANLVAVSIWMLISYYWYSLKFFVKI